MNKAPRPTSHIGSHHYLLGLAPWFAQHLPQSEAQGTGIFHTPLQYPTRKDLATVYLNLKTAAYPLVDAVDLGVSEIIYLRRSRRKQHGVVLGSPQKRMAQEAQW